MTDALDLHRSRRELFGGDVAAYELGRPRYPHRVFELLADTCGLRPGSRVLEIGPGTGQATVDLLELGASVTAVELSEEFAAALREKFAAYPLTVLCGEFEALELAPDSFDLIVAATSFHWVSPTDRGLVRCADLLSTGGWLAIWWTVFGDRSRPDPFQGALDQLLVEIEPALADRPIAGNPFTTTLPYAEDADARTAEINATGRFGPVLHENIRWMGRHGTNELSALFASFSSWLALPTRRRQAALGALERLADQQFGGLVERPYQTPIYLAQRRAASVA